MQLAVGKVEFGPARVGAVLDRPTGEAALLWQLYADSLERERELRKKLESKKKNQ